MDITLTINGRNFAPRVSTYKVRKIVETVKVVTTLNGTEHPIQRSRDEITFSLIPYDDVTANQDFISLSPLQFTATYTDPNSAGNSTKIVRITSSLDSVFGIKSINGNRYYKGGKIVLRALEVN